MPARRELFEMKEPAAAVGGGGSVAKLGNRAGAVEGRDDGRIYDPACGSGGSLPARKLRGVRFAEKDRAVAQGVVPSEKIVEFHGGLQGAISIYGQESNATTRRLPIMNLAIRGIDADFGPEHVDTFRCDLHPDLCA